MKNPTLNPEAPNLAAIGDQVSTATTSQIEAWIGASLDTADIEQLFNA